jgi:ATP-binding cassette subfamily F protein uup
MVGGQPRHVVSYMRDFLFAPEQAGQPLEALSGGERGRLMLARALAAPANILVLDEPTNDLDLETLDLLQEMIADYKGTVLLVSHDRDFLDRTVTSIVAAEGNGRWVEYAGGYSDMLAQRAGRDGGDEAKPEPEPPRRRAERRVTQAAQPKRKLSFHEKHALETLPGRIESLQAEVQRLSLRLADPELFRNDPAAYERAASGLGKAEADLAAAEDEWLRLELLRESVEG